MTVVCIMLSLFCSAPGFVPTKPLTPLPGYDWTAPLKRAAGEPAPPPLPVEQVVAGFMDYVSKSPLYDAKAKSFVKEQRDKTNPDALKDFICLAYSILSPDFKKGLDLIDEDKGAEAAKVMERLSHSNDPYLATTAANLAATTMIELDDIDGCLNMLQGVCNAHKPIERYTTASDNFRFLLGYCQVHDLQYAEAYASFEDFLKNYPQAPERLRVTASQILTELSRRTPHQLGDVRDLLDYARRRLTQQDVGEKVIERQQEALALLDTLIEEAQQQEQNKQNQKQNKGKGSPKPGEESGGKAGSGAKRSTLPTGQAGETNLSKTRAKPGDAWGKMPPRQRDEILQSLQKQFPTQYRELLEQYYKQLAKDAPAP